MKLEGLKPFSGVKHLVVDEMQDYSAVQYKVISELFPCKKTILGDINQSVNPFSSSGLDTIQSVFSDATAMTMLKSYRSTFEITRFTKKIRPNIEVEAIERHGKEPGIYSLKNNEDEINQIRALINEFKAGDFNSLGIICKTQAQADKLHLLLKTDFRISLLNAISTAFGGGIVITTAHLAKGLEFDCVVVPHAGHKNYHTEPDRQMLYVACTRAMHRLDLIHQGKISDFLIQ